ncbi:MAG: hypothetical protein AB8B56_17100 [Crocinitomicaceae bacterium]
MSRITLVLFGAIVLFACNKNKAYVPVCESTVPVTYTSHIKTIIDDNCMNCHDAGSNDGAYNTYNALSGVTSNGTFEQVVLVDKSMPKFSNLEESELNLIKCWVENGYAE